MKTLKEQITQKLEFNYNRWEEAKNNLETKEPGTRIYEIVLGQKNYYAGQLDALCEIRDILGF